MKIVHLTLTDISSDSRILKEMESLSQANSLYDVVGVGVTRDKNIDNSDKKNIQSIVLRSRRLAFLPTALRHTLTFIEFVYKTVFTTIKLKPKVVHCHDFSALPSGVLVKLITGAKVIYDAHELESNRNGLKKNLGKLTLFFERFFWKSVDALIVVSPSIDKWYKKNIGEKYSQIILNSPVLEKKSERKNESYLKNHFSISQKSKVFLYIGVLSEGRGIHLMVDAFKKLNSNSHLVFLGYGVLSDELKQLSKKYSNIHVHDAVTHKKVVPIAQSADVGMCLIQNVSLSDYYCLPNKLFEYCFAEIPVLASNFPDISFTINKYNLGKCCDLDAKSIYDAIIEFENTIELPMINVDDLYELSWGAQEKKLITLYDNLLN